VRRHSHDARSSAIWTKPILSGIDPGKSTALCHDVAKVAFGALALKKKKDLRLLA